MLDIKITNGKIIDCENKCFVEADVFIKDGKIVSIGGDLSAKSVVDADGKIVSAGFIDIHMHEEDIALSKGKLDISEVMIRGGVTTAVGGNCGSNRNNFYEFIEFINKNGYPVNFMTYVGHNYLRNLAGNSDIYKKSSQTQLDFIASEVEKAVQFGALGVSYGLEYCPGIDMEESVAVCNKVLGRDDLLVSIHARSDAKNALNALDEIEELTKQIKIPVQISHISSLCAYGNMNECLERIDKMIASKLNVQCDAYPYGAFSCKIGSSVFDEGCFENWDKDYSAIMLAEEPYKGVFCDKELFYKARREYPTMYAVAMVMNESEIKTALQKDYVSIGSDGGYNNHSGHPRGAGTFARVLGRYSRDEGVLDIFKAVEKMTILPARRLRLNNCKGQIKEGFDADIVVFDYDKIIDRADFQSPQLAPDGISYVIVNGKVAYANGEIVSHSQGKFINRV